MSPVAPLALAIDRAPLKTGQEGGLFRHPSRHTVRIGKSGFQRSGLSRCSPV